MSYLYLQETIGGLNAEMELLKVKNSNLAEVNNEKLQTMSLIQDHLILAQQQLMDLYSLIAARKSWVVSTEQFQLGGVIGRSTFAVVNQARFLGNHVAAKHFIGHILTPQSMKQLEQQCEIGFVC